MHEFAGLTAQDFRDAWPQAYKQAICQVGILMEYCEQQLGRATVQMVWSQQATEKAGAQLKASQGSLANALERASRDANHRLAGLVESLEERTLELARREQALAAARIDHERRRLANVVALRKNYLSLVNAPVITRLKWALGSRGRRLQCIATGTEASP